MGTPDFSVPALEALAARHEIVAIYTQPPRPAGRGKGLRKSAVHIRAEELGLPVFTPVSLKEPDEQEAFQALAAEVAVVVAYGILLPPEVLRAPARGCLNIHPSLLPRWRGAAPIQRAIMAGDSRTGVAIMQMDEGLDTGPVLLSESTGIGAGEIAGDLHDRLKLMGADLILRALDRLDALTPRPQPVVGAVYAAKIDKAEAQPDWARPAVEIDRLIRSLSPFPGTWVMIGDERVKLLRSRVVAGSGQPGEILGGFTIACGDGAIEILEAQREGRRPMPAAEILNGLVLPGRLKIVSLA